MKLPILKFVYQGLLTGMPLLTYNPITKNNFIAPVDIEPFSTYLNFKLSKNQVMDLNQYIHSFNDNLDIVPVRLLTTDKKENYLSINIYNCTTPIMSQNKEMITRCEINTYIYDKKNNQYGTIILDYISNTISMDPINIFKLSNQLVLSLNESKNKIKCIGDSKQEKISIDFDFKLIENKKLNLDHSLIDYTDNIYYKNGIYDKVYYDSSLTNAKVYKVDRYNFNFTYRNLDFNHLDSLFYFNDKIYFVGCMWKNLYDI